MMQLAGCFGRVIWGFKVQVPTQEGPSPSLARMQTDANSKFHLPSNGCRDVNDVDDEYDDTSVAGGDGHVIEVGLAWLLIGCRRSPATSTATRSKVIL